MSELITTHVSLVHSLWTKTHLQIKLISIHGCIMYVYYQPIFSWLDLIRIAMFKWNCSSRSFVRPRRVFGLTRTFTAHHHREKRESRRLVKVNSEFEFSQRDERFSSTLSCSSSTFEMLLSFSFTFNVLSFSPPPRINWSRFEDEKDEDMDDISSNLRFFLYLNRSICSRLLMFMKRQRSFS